MATVDYNLLKGKLSDQAIQQIASQRGDNVINAPKGFSVTPAQSTTPSTPSAPSEPGRMPKTPQFRGSLGLPSGGMKSVLFANPNTQEITGVDANGNTIVHKANQPSGIMGAAYNLTLKPIVEGVKNYGELLSTAIGTVGLSAINEMDPKGQSTVISPIRNWLVKNLEPVVTSTYQDPLHTIINGGLQTIGGMAAGAQIATVVNPEAVIQGLISGTAKLAMTNLVYNAAFYSTGEAIKIAEGKKGDLVKGALGFTNDGPFVAAMGDNTTSRTLDTVTQLVAPIIAGRIAEKAKNIDISSGFSQKTRMEVAGNVLGKVPGAGQYESEQLMSKTLQISQSSHIKDIAREFDKKNPDGIIKTTSENLNKFIPALSDAVGPQSRGSVFDYVDKQITSTTFGQGLEGSKLAKENRQYLSSLLSGTGVSKESTTLTDLNNARMAVYKSIPDSWFKKMDTSTTNGIKNWMRMQTALSLKEIIASADTTGYVKSALDVQSTAYHVGPVLSDIAEKTSYRGMGVSRYIYAPIFNSIEHMMEPLKIGIARSIQSKSMMGASSFSGDIPGMKGELPILKSTQSPVTPPPGFGAGEKPIPPAPPSPLKPDLSNAPSGPIARFDLRARQGSPRIIWKKTP